MNTWNNNPMQFRQNQLNFLIWCGTVGYGTVGCGVSYYDHINNKDKLIVSVYKFYVYFTTRRILSEMKCPLPQDAVWSINNTYDSRENEQI